MHLSPRGRPADAPPSPLVGLVRTSAATLVADGRLPAGISLSVELDDLGVAACKHPRSSLISSAIPGRDSVRLRPAINQQ